MCATDSTSFARLLNVLLKMRMPFRSLSFVQPFKMQWSLIFYFQDISKHRFFNTNNLWVRLDRLKEEIIKAGGFIPLPMIKNAKTIDPKDDASTAVIQLETAMGAAIEAFSNSGAVCVPRERFAPVKKCNDLLMLRSDCYTVTPDARLVLSPGIEAAPEVNLDGKKYKLVQALEQALAFGVPSLSRCTNLKVLHCVQSKALTAPFICIFLISPLALGGWLCLLFAS